MRRFRLFGKIELHRLNSAFRPHCTVFCPCTATEILRNPTKCQLVAARKVVLYLPTRPLLIFCEVDAALLDLIIQRYPAIAYPKR
jgi:hypothetical protein